MANDHTHTLMGNSSIANGSTLISIFSGTLSWITAKDLHDWVPIIAGMVAILSGLLAAVHYVLQIIKHFKKN